MSEGFDFPDSVMGNWNLLKVPTSGGGTSPGYDTLNRLIAMQNTGTTSTSSQYAAQYLCWSYDPFGNRTQQVQQGTPCTGSGPSSSNSVLNYNSNNQLSSVTPPGGGSPSPSPLSYDQAGNVLFDGGTGNTYLYDAEGRICAVSSPGLYGTVFTGYIYDADGTRVGKGTIERWGTCDPATNGFQPTADYILGPGGEQLTEMGMDENGQMAWKHTNVWAGGTLLATYDRDGLHYHLSDWLGTRRVQTDAGGAIEDACASLPYGDALSCIGPTFTTEHHFTGKERDTESGNDYFGARYYASTMGRFLSPDWSATEEPVPYAVLGDPQSLNLYAYVRNNPLSRTDPNGHWCIGGVIGTTCTPAPPPPPAPPPTPSPGSTPGTIPDPKLSGPTAQQVNAQVIGKEKDAFEKCAAPPSIADMAKDAAKNAVKDMAKDVLTKPDPKDFNPAETVNDSIKENASKSLKLQNWCLDLHPLAALDGQYQGTWKPGDYTRPLFVYIPTIQPDGSLK